MLARVLKDTLIYGISGLLSRGIGFLLLPLYARTLSEAEYGALDLFTVASAFFAVTVSLEILQGAGRYLSDFNGDEQNLTRFGATTFWFTLVTDLPVVAAVIVFRAPISRIAFDSDDYATPIIWAALSYLASGWVRFAQNQFRYELQPKKAALVAIAQASATCATAYLLVGLWNLSLVGAVASLACGNAIAGGLGLLLLRHRIKAQFDPVGLREMLRFSLPLVPSSMSVVAAAYADRIAISYYMTPEDLGVYGIGHRFALIIWLVLLGFQGSVTPLVLAYHQADRTRDDLARLFRLFWAGSMILLINLAVAGPAIVRVVATDRYLTAADLIPILSLATLLTQVYIFFPGLGIAKKTRAIATINLVGLALNIALNVLLVPLIGLEGAAVATLAASILTASACYLLSQREYPVPHHPYQLTIGLLVTASTFLVLRQKRYLVDGFELQDIAILLAVNIAIVATVFLLRLVRREDIAQALRVLQTKMRAKQ